jgi:uncharacterized protein
MVLFLPVNKYVLFGFHRRSLFREEGAMSNLEKGFPMKLVSEPCPPFRPYPLTSGGHRQTLLGDWIRKYLGWSPPAEDVIVDVNHEVRLLTRVSWQPGSREARPALILIHGMGGSSERGYLFSTGLMAWKYGWHVVRMNMRGCGRGSEVYPGLYHSGLDTDLIAVLQVIHRWTPRLAVCGFSLGGNLTLLALGRCAGKIPSGLFAGAAVSPAMDLEACAQAIELPSNRHYQIFFCNDLCENYRHLQRLNAQRYEYDRQRNVRTIREFDELITAYYGGFSDAGDYYRQSSAGPYLGSISTPTLILSAADDPFIPVEIFSRFPLPAKGSVRIEITETGGHMGFLGRTKAPCHFWAAERVVSFLNDHHLQRISS